MKQINLYAVKFESLQQGDDVEWFLSTSIEQATKDFKKMYAEHYNFDDIEDKIEAYVIDGIYFYKDKKYKVIVVEDNETIMSPPIYEWKQWEIK
jgi:hypothetical protein